jgi:hypothetical protein
MVVIPAKAPARMFPTALRNAAFAARAVIVNVVAKSDGDFASHGS